jgi:outer membrane receptor for monomeric catechols
VIFDGKRVLCGWSCYNNNNKITVIYGAKYIQDAEHIMDDINVDPSLI